MLPDDYTPNTRKLTPEMEKAKWPEGYCPNPNGRPKGSKNRSTIAREILEMQHTSGQTYEYASTKAVAEKAAAGDVTAWEKIMDAGYGKLTDKTQMEVAATVQRIERTVIDPKNDNAED